MSLYKLQFSVAFDRSFRKIHPTDKKRVLEEVKKLAEEPFPKGKKVKHLVGTQGWRLRVGKVRVIYFVEEKNKIIFLEDVAYRKDIY